MFSVTGHGAVIRHDRLIQGGPPLWVAALVFLLGWQVMLWTMMVPASLTVIGARNGLRDGASFVAGYLAVWSGFGLLAFFSDVGVHATVNHWAWLAFHPWLIAGTTLVLAGTYQLSNLKVRSLSACRAVMSRHHDRPLARGGSLAEGVAQGIRCLGSGWALMLLAFGLGAGSVTVMALITAIMVWEVTPSGVRAVKIVGYCLIAIGVVILAGPVQGSPLWPA